MKFFLVLLTIISFSSSVVARSLIFGGAITENQIDGLAKPDGAVISPDGKFVYVGSDAGGDDAIAWFTYNNGRLSRSGILKYNQYLGIPFCGTSIILSKDGSFLYSACAGSGMISWFSRNSATGAITYGGNVKQDVNGVKGISTVEMMALSPDGRYLYTAAPGNKTLAWFLKNSDGSLAYRGFLKQDSSGVKGLSTIQGMTMSADGRTVYVASGYNEHSISWFFRDSLSGDLSYGGNLADTNTEKGLYDPRAVVSSIDGKFVYVRGEINSGISRPVVSWFSRDSAGALTPAGIARSDSSRNKGLAGVQHLAVSGDNRFIYTANWDTIGIYLRDTVTGAITSAGSITENAGGDGLEEIVSIVFSPSGDLIYTASYNDNALTVLKRDTSTGLLTYLDIIKDLEGLYRAAAVCVSSDGKNVYAVGTGLTWYLRDSATGALRFKGRLTEDDWELGNEAISIYGAEALTLSSDGRHLYVAGTDDNTVSWFPRDAESGELGMGKKIDRFSLGNQVLNSPRALVISPDGKNVYVASERDSTLAIFKRNALTGNLTYSGRMKEGLNGVDGLQNVGAVAISPDGKFVYTSGRYEKNIGWFQRDSGSGTLTFINKILASGSVYLTISNNGRFLFSADYDSDRLDWAERDISSGTPSFLYNGNPYVNGFRGLPHLYSLAVCPSNRYVYAVALDTNLVCWFKVDLDSTVPRLIYNGMANKDRSIASLSGSRGIAASPDGRNVYVVSYEDHAINWFTVDTTETPMTAVHDKIAAENQIKPMSFRRNGTASIVRFFTNNNSPVRIGLFTLRGTKLYDRKTTSVTAGWNTVELERSHLGAGFYILQLQQTGSVLRRKVVIPTGENGGAGDN